MSADGIRLDEGGVGAAVAALSGHAASASGNARGISSALSEAESSVRSAALVSALGGFVSRFSGTAAPVGVHVDALAGGVREAATAILQTDDQLGSDARAFGAR